MNINKIKMEIWEAQNEVYRAHTLRGNVPVESILGDARARRIEGLMDRLDAIGEKF